MGDSERDRLLELDHWPGQTGLVGSAMPETMAVWLRHRRSSTSQIENPSWLLSLVTHMAVLIVIGALASAPRARGHLSPIVLTMSLAEGDDQANSSPIATTVVQSQPQKKNRSTGDQSDRDTLAPGESTEVAETSAPERAERESPEAPPRVTAGKPVVLWGRLPENFAIRDSSLNSETPPLRWSTASTRGWRPNSHDEVVERFIQYDVGRLPGAAGAQALRNFQQLGPDAIPALVRGLNQAATMRASCPIGVISSRLNTLLRQTDDPRMVRYAVENIGRGVDTTAPHYRSIQSLLHRLKKTFGSQVVSSPSHVAEPARTWWMPDPWQPKPSDARIRSDQQALRSPVEPSPRPTSRVGGNREPADKRPGWSTLESLLDGPGALKARDEPHLERARGDERALPPPPTNVPGRMGQYD